MSNLRQQLQDSISAEDDVGAAIHGLWAAIAAIDRLRMKNATADLVLRDHEEIEGAFLLLRDLNSDIHQSVYKRAAE
jgi:Fic family protein